MLTVLSLVTSEGTTEVTTEGSGGEGPSAAIIAGGVVGG